MRLKGKANELFKAGKYQEAESGYQESLKALKDGVLFAIMAASVKSGIFLKDLNCKITSG